MVLGGETRVLDVESERERSRTTPGSLVWTPG